jgi:hypothetical protein
VATHRLLRQLQPLGQRSDAARFGVRRGGGAEHRHADQAGDQLAEVVHEARRGPEQVVGHQPHRPAHRDPGLHRIARGRQLAEQAGGHQLAVEGPDPLVQHPGGVEIGRRAQEGLRHHGAGLGQGADALGLELLQPPPRGLVGELQGGGHGADAHRPPLLVGGGRVEGAIAGARLRVAGQGRDVGLVDGHHQHGVDRLQPGHAAAGAVDHEAQRQVRQSPRALGPVVISFVGHTGFPGPFAARDATPRLRNTSL